MTKTTHLTELCKCCWLLTMVAAASRQQKTKSKTSSSEDYQTITQSRTSCCQRLLTLAQSPLPQHSCGRAAWPRAGQGKTNFSLVLPFVGPFVPFYCSPVSPLSSALVLHRRSLPAFFRPDPGPLFNMQFSVRIGEL